MDSKYILGYRLHFEFSKDLVIIWKQTSVTIIAYGNVLLCIGSYVKNAAIASLKMHLILLAF